MSVGQHYEAPTYRALMDLCKESMEPKIEGANVRMVRVSISGRFETAVASSWLRISEKLNSHGKRPSEDYGLQWLMSQNRFRVLDVRSGEVVALHRHERYFALSYVWGRSVAPMTAQSAETVYTADESSLTNDAAVRMIHWKRLPRTIRDAANLVQQLDERYLWIDSICIDQRDRADKATIIAEMANIYSMAALTIIAADGDGADAGLRRFIHHSLAEEPDVTFVQNGKRISLLPSRPNFENCIQKTIWNTRGWTYQKRILSTQCLIFTATEVLFTSRNFRTRESFALEPFLIPSGERRRWIRNSTSLNDGALSISRSNRSVYMIVLYGEAVTAFTSRKLNYCGDRLNAFMGIADRIYTLMQVKTHQDTYRGLLPGEMFYYSLLWQSNLQAGDFRRRIYHDTTKELALPSWSGAGWDLSLGMNVDPRFGRGERRKLPLRAVVKDVCNIMCISHRDGRRRAVAFRTCSLPDETKRMCHIALVETRYSVLHRET